MTVWEFLYRLGNNTGGSRPFRAPFFLPGM